MTMNIGISAIILNRNRRGFESYLRQLVESLAQQDGDFHLFLYTDKPLREFDRFGKVTVRIIPNRIKTFFWRNVSLPLRVFRDKIDVFHFPDNSVWLVAWKPTVVTLHDISCVLFKEKKLMSFRMIVLIKFIYFAIKKVSRQIITDSKTSKNDIEDYFDLPPDRVAAIPLSCGDIYKVISGFKIQEHFDIDMEFILFVGGIDRRKNIDNLIKALEIVRQRCARDIKLVIIGEYKKSKGGHYLRRRELIYDEKVKDFVKLMGYVDDEKLVAFYNAATMFVLPSVYEGFGITVLEAMSCATPVLVSDRPWGHDVCGENAMFFDPDNEVDIAEKISIFLNDKELSDRFCQKGLKHVKNFSWHKTAEQTMEIYKKVLFE